MITNLYLLTWPTMIYSWRKKKINKGKKRKKEAKKIPKGNVNVFSFRNT